MGKKSRRLQFHGSRSSTSLDRSLLLSASNANHNSGSNRARHKGQKIAFSRKFPFMKSRERLNRLDDDDDDLSTEISDLSNRWAQHVKVDLNKKLYSKTIQTFNIDAQGFRNTKMKIPWHGK